MIEEGTRILNENTKADLSWIKRSRGHFYLSERNQLNKTKVLMNAADENLKFVFIINEDFSCGVLAPLQRTVGCKYLFKLLMFSKNNSFYFHSITGCYLVSNKKLLINYIFIYSTARTNFYVCIFMMINKTENGQNNIVM